MAPTAPHREKEVVVLVTGYGPFLDKFPINSSWEICSRLPDYLPATPSSPTKIRIVKYEHPIRVSYTTVASLVPKLASMHHPKPDIILHMGLAAGRSYFTLERQSTRRAYYNKKDIDRRVFTEEQNQKLWHDAPDILRPTFDFEDVFARTMGHLAGVDVDVRPSDDAGGYLCGFIYYASMAHFWQHDHAGERPVLFLHVPDCPTEESLQLGQEVVFATVRGLVESWSRGRLVNSLLGVEEQRVIAARAAASSDVDGPGAVADIAREVTPPRR